MTMGDTLSSVGVHACPLTVPDPELVGAGWIFVCLRGCQRGRVSVDCIRQRLLPGPSVVIPEGVQGAARAAHTRAHPHRLCSTLGPLRSRHDRGRQRGTAKRSHLPPGNRVEAAPADRRLTDCHAGAQCRRAVGGAGRFSRQADAAPLRRERRRGRSSAGRHSSDKSMRHCRAARPGSRPELRADRC